MNIPINRNIDEFQDDFYKGLSFRQTCFSAVTLVSGGAVFTFTYAILGIPQMLAVYLTIAAAAPWAAWGFIKIKGMPVNTYLKKRRELGKNPVLLYRSCEGRASEGAARMERKKKIRRQKKRDKKAVLCSPQKGAYL